MKKSFLTVFIAALVAGCASAPSVDKSEPRRLLGREDNVRVDAQIFDDRIGSGSNVRVTYEIENLRPDAIAVADLVPDVSYDLQSRTLVINIGSEVPGNELVPRLIKIASGERKAATTVAKVNLNLPPASPLAAYPRYIQLKINYLSEIEPFEQLIGIPETAVHDPALAGELFTKWVEANSAVRTNAVPIDWGGRPLAGPDASRRRF